MAKKPFLFCTVFMMVLSCAGCGSQRTVEASFPSAAQSLPEQTASPTPEITPTPEIPAAPIGGDSNMNDWRIITDGESLYFTYLDPKGLRKISAPYDYENESVIFDEGYGHLSATDDGIYLWGYDNALYRADEYGYELVFDELYGIVNRMWHYEGKLYYFMEGEPSSNDLYVYDIESGENTLLPPVVYGSNPWLVVAGGSIFVTSHTREPDFGEVNLPTALHKYPLDGTGEPEEISPEAYWMRQYGDKLYYVNPRGDAESSFCSYDIVTGEIKEYFSPYNGGRYVVEDDYVYYAKEVEDNFNHLVKRSLTDGSEELLFDVISVEEPHVIMGDDLFFSTWHLDTRSEYIIPLDGGEAIARSAVFPYAEPDPTPTPAPIIEGTSYLFLEATDLAACFKLVNESGELIMTELLDAGESTTISFPSGKYYLRIAEGSDWISDDEAFGPNGYYTTTELYTFEANASYSIGTGTRGDFYSDSQSGFTGD